MHRFISIRTLFVIGILLLSGVYSYGQMLSAEEVISRALEYHDPNNKWPMLNVKLYFEEMQPGGDIRETEAVIDNSQGYFHLNRGDYEIHGMKMDSCFVEKGDYDCARAERMRNYYVYLWGLPMKLRDAGTQVREKVAFIDWQNTPCYEVVVDYPEDRWFFYFTRNEFRMIGYMFVKKDGSGEKIVLNGERDVEGIKIPAQRSWFVIGTKEYLGTDKLVRAQRLASE